MVINGEPIKSFLDYSSKANVYNFVVTSVEILTREPLFKDMSKITIPFVVIMECNLIYLLAYTQKISFNVVGMVVPPQSLNSMKLSKVLQFGKCWTNCLNKLLLVVKIKVFKLQTPIIKFAWVLHLAYLCHCLSSILPHGSCVNYLHSSRDFIFLLSILRFFLIFRKDIRVEILCPNDLSLLKTKISKYLNQC